MFESSDPRVVRTHQLEEELRKISNEDILLSGETAVLLQASGEYVIEKLVYAYRDGADTSLVEKAFSSSGFVRDQMSFAGCEVWCIPDIDYSIVVEANKRFSTRAKVDHHCGIYIESGAKITSDLCKAALRELTLSVGIALSVWWDDAKFYGDQMLAQDEIAMTVKMLGIENCREQFNRALQMSGIKVSPNPMPRFEGMLTEIQARYGDSHGLDRAGEVCTALFGIGSELD